MSDPERCPFMALGYCFSCAKELQERIAELEATFDLRWKADMRAIKRWQEATGRELVRPDHADLLLLVLERLEKVEKACDELYNFARDYEWGSEGHCPGCGYSEREGHKATCYVSNMLFRLNPYKTNSATAEGSDAAQ